MISTKTLVSAADAYMTAAAGLPEKTLSYRVFGDSKKLSALRDGAEITLGRFNDAMCWFAANWPEGSEPPAVLLGFVKPAPAEDAA